jgi:DNA invertase Pin-like site-specific DNA recombinase
MIIGYARVSTEDQNLDLQMDALKEAGCEKIYEDVISGSKTERNGLDQVMQSLRRGDTLVVWKLDRLGRSLQHLISVIDDLREREIYFKSLKESLDTSSSTGKLIFHIFGALAEFERDIIRERTVAGLAAARARGRIGGRPRLMDEQKVKLARTLIEDDSRSVTEICEILGVSKSTFYRCVKQH